MLLTLYCKPKTPQKRIYKKKWWGSIISRSQMYPLHSNILMWKTARLSKNHQKSVILHILQKTSVNSFFGDSSESIFLYFLYQQHYFSLIYKTPILLKNINALDVVPYDILKYLINSVKHIKWKKYFINHSNEIVEILFISLWLKNLKLFMDWMRKHFEKTNLKKHRRLFLLLNLLLGKFMWNYNLFLNLEGLRVSVIGKFGKAGSVRKSRRYIRRGKCSYTTKKIALISQTNIIRTLTGVFSIKMEVFFL